MNKAFGLVIFVAGAVVGSVVTWHLLKNRYEEPAQEDFQSRRQLKKNEEEEKKHLAKKAIEKPDLTAYSSIIKRENYDQTDYSNITEEVDDSESDISDDNLEDTDVEDEEDHDDTKPYGISPDEFGIEDGYDIISLTYYSDAVLADEDNELVEDIENTVGFEALSAFGQYEEDTVHVRNPVTKCDYEILRASRTYTSVLRQEGRNHSDSMED